MGRKGGFDELGAGRLPIIGGLEVCPASPENLEIYNIQARECQFQHSELDTDLS